MKQLPYNIDTSKKILYRAEAWCREQWGPRWEAVDNRSGTWCVFWGGNRVEMGKPFQLDMVSNQYRWHFATEQQLTWFKLRWA